MRIAAVAVFAITVITPVSAIAAPGAVALKGETKASPIASSPTQKLFEQFGLFGIWASDCKKSAGPGNPHVIITAPTPERVQEDHDLGPDYAINRYSVLSAKRISATSLSVEVLFEPGTENEEEQRLVFLIHNDTRRTLFNQPKEGTARVKDGVVVANGVKTPLLMKCKP
jgi:hypothetical protein